MQVALLTAENAMLRDALLSTIPHMDASSAQLNSTATAVHIPQAQVPHVDPNFTNGCQSSMFSSSPSGLLVPDYQDEGAIASYAAADELSTADTGHQAGTRSGSDSLEPNTPPQTSGTLQSHSQQLPESEATTPPVPLVVPAAKKLSKLVSFSNDVMFDTLNSVLQSRGVHSQDDSEQPSSEGSCQSDSSESSQWSGDELLAIHAAEQVNRISSSSSQVQSLSGMLQIDRHAAQDQASSDLDGEELDTEGVEEEKDTGPKFSRSSISRVRRCATNLEVNLRKRRDPHCIVPYSHIELHCAMAAQTLQYLSMLPFAEYSGIYQALHCDSDH